VLARSEPSRVRALAPLGRKRPSICPASSRGVLADAGRAEALRLALSAGAPGHAPGYTFFDALHARIAEGRAAPLGVEVLPLREHWMNLWW
jgi:DNA-binding IclR family transcriptional regulator